MHALSTGERKISIETIFSSTGRDPASSSRRHLVVRQQRPPLPPPREEVMAPAPAPAPSSYARNPAATPPQAAFPPPSFVFFLRGAPRSRVTEYAAPPPCSIKQSGSHRRPPPLRPPRLPLSDPRG
uniref:Uncharacterized protein n=1 Tax=Leersia perrieri TaxID=77586 RepID=A0A0D9XHF9_9ORYZ